MFSLRFFLLHILYCGLVLGSNWTKQDVAKGVEPWSWPHAQHCGTKEGCPWKDNAHIQSRALAMLSSLSSWLLGSLSRLRLWEVSLGLTPGLLQLTQFLSRRQMLLQDLKSFLGPPTH